MKQKVNGCGGKRNTHCSARTRPEPTMEMHRYAHPIERSPRSAESCDALRMLLCSLAGQNQVLCAMKAELDEILTVLEELRDDRADPDGDCEEESEEESAREP